MIFTIAVGHTNRRPIVVDEDWSFVTIDAASEIQAQQLAAQLVGCRAEMVTSTTILN